MSLVRIRSIALERRHNESVNQDTGPVGQGVQVYISLIIHSEVCPAVSRNEMEGAIPTYDNATAEAQSQVFGGVSSGSEHFALTVRKETVHNAKQILSEL
jgi:hypothetical protein